MISLGKLTDIYNNWGDKEKLQPLESADAMLWDNRVNEKHKLWLERFIRLWDLTQDKSS
jgi:hypothetical protein